MGINYTRRTSKTCVYWQKGRCNRNPCRFLHGETPSPHAAHNNANNSYKYGRKPHSPSKNSPKNNSKTVLAIKSAARDTETCVVQSSNKSSPSICKYWMNRDCVHGERCRNLHSWFSGDGFSMLAKLHEHKKVITGIAFPDGSDKLYTGSTDGTVRIWDGHTGQCVRVINLGAEVTSLISEGPWIFVGIQNAVKAWNIQTGLEFTLDGPKGRVLAMTVGNDTLFAAAEDGVITAWRGSSDTKSPFELVASLTGHTKAVVCLTVGCNTLYSGSMDQSIMAWDTDTLQCKMTLNVHTDVVTSLICWDNFLLSSSSDCTINIWAATEEGPLKVIYTHYEEHGVVSLFGMSDPEEKEIALIELGPGRLFFTGDGSGLLKVWKWLEEPKVVSSSPSSMDDI